MFYRDATDGDQHLRRGHPIPDHAGGWDDADHGSVFVELQHEREQLDRLHQRGGAVRTRHGTDGLYHFKVQMFTTVVSWPAIEASFVGIRFP